MRIDSLWIESWKNLRNFSVDFDETRLTTVIVGHNGTGKSNLLEAIVIIFRDLDLGLVTNFDYHLKYERSKKTIELDYQRNRSSGRLSVLVDGQKLSSKAFLERDEHGISPYLPTNVFGYYSGLSPRMEELFDEHQKRFYNLSIKPESARLNLRDQRLRRPLFYVRQQHSQFVLLAFLLHQNTSGAEDEDFLRRYLNVEAFDSALFVMREPFAWKWKERAQGSGDERFWRADGIVRPLLDRLYALSLAPFKCNNEVKIDFRHSSNREQLYLFLPDLASLQELASEYASQQEFFKTLESTFISDLIQEVRVRVKIREVDGSITFRELSEGEQQLLTVLGLLWFTKEEESLFLLDEPDTHLNPIWSIQYLDILSKFVRETDKSHIILTSHNPLVVSSLFRSQVQIMRWDEEKNRNVAAPPETDPRGMGIAGLLTSDLFGLRAALDLPTLKLLDKKRELAVKQELSPEERIKLDDLNRQLEPLDAGSSIPDPMFPLFVSSMSRYEKEQGWTEPNLTEEQRTDRIRYALSIVRRFTEQSIQEVEGDDT